MAFRVWVSGDKVLLDFGEARAEVARIEAVEIAEEICRACVRRPGPAHHHGWTEDEDAELRRRYAAGETARYIAMKMGRTAAAISRRITTLEIAARRPDQPDRARATLAARRAAAE